MSHIFTDDGKQWYLIPELPIEQHNLHLPVEIEKAKDNALPIVNPEVIPFTGEVGVLVEWPGTWEEFYIDTRMKSIKHAKLIAPQQPQADGEQKCAFCGWKKKDHRLNCCYHYSDEDTDYFYKDKFFKPMTQSNAPNEGREEKPYFKLSKNEYGKMWLFYNPHKDGGYNCWEPINERFWIEFEKLLSLGKCIEQLNNAGFEVLFFKDDNGYHCEVLKNDLYVSSASADSISNVITKASELDKT